MSSEQKIPKQTIDFLRNWKKYLSASRIKKDDVSNPQKIDKFSQS